MKILYRQLSRKNEDMPRNRLLEESGIGNCYFKHIVQPFSDNSNTKKRHSHTVIEIHMMVTGSQTYESDGASYRVNAGEFLMIPKNKPHKMIDAEYPVEKYAVIFSCDNRFLEDYGLEKKNECVHGQLSRRVRELFASIEEEYASPCQGSEILIENMVFELIVCLMRDCCGIGSTVKRKRGEDAQPPTDERVELAKQFIIDNIEEPLQIGEVASYCYLSKKQLTRLFEVNVGMTIATYIRNEKIRHIEMMLADPSFSLTAISEVMGFPSESGFNAFFKKYNGMPPGEYRKMIIDGKA